MDNKNGMNDVTKNDVTKEEMEEIYEQISKAVSLTEKGMSKEATAIYEKLLKYEVPEVYNNLGNIYRRDGMLGKAVEMYRKTIQLDNSFSAAYFNLACALMEMERYSESIMFFEKAEKLGLKGFDLDVQLTLCYIAVGNHLKARERLKDEKVRKEVEKYIEGELRI
ncbi:MAG TPA: tetratricopeptide repeat protein [Fervidobacterium sp.]|nr:tetratricopeptide repeat protein [Fervidobacterium sp.]HPT54294.1 tetratricopeptide repeat protein [Fervidobacterium sp.]HPZ17557.1 tetratricopeptide repeat protein [Fervidobacterium sp.]HQE48624.1 tetratricopeptide repeat protein [Fervidobacterium sp.]HUM42480.1 tetratricopeptide repeat protein [Fervidobacterium sp.]